jgi:tyrosyl-tRNA synthetase
VTGRDLRQQVIAKWARDAFGEREATDLRQRALRLLEESIEAYQAAGGESEMAQKLVAFVFGRPKGELAQEIAQVQLCALVLAHAAGESADALESKEVDRVLALPIEHFTKRNAAKNAAGFLATGEMSPSQATAAMLRPLQDAAEESPRYELARADLLGMSIVDVLARTVSKSKADARRLIAQGAAWFNGRPVEHDRPIVEQDLEPNGMVTVGTKKDYWLVRAV